ncbi:MAG: GNAT family N-acetyltransferase [Pseudomonadales bacterium]
MITLEEVTQRNIHDVLALEVADHQKLTYPRSNAYSMAEGFFPSDDDAVWMRAICSDGVPIGFMMTSESPEDGDYFLWRMMIDKRFQGKGFGAKAMRLLIQRIRNNGNPRTLILSHLKDNTEAGNFYMSLGFSYTGNELGDGDLEMALHFDF